ncbi:MAG: hypothetical protein AAGF11_43325 [Myxococcota bacterium]
MKTMRHVMLGLGVVVLGLSGCAERPGKKKEDKKADAKKAKKTKAQKAKDGKIEAKKD